MRTGIKDNSSCQFMTLLTRNLLLKIKFHNFSLKIWVDISCGKRLAVSMHAVAEGHQIEVKVGVSDVHFHVRPAHYGEENPSHLLLLIPL